MNRFPIFKQNNTQETILFLFLRPNIRFQPLPKAGARHEATL